MKRLIAIASGLGIMLGLIPFVTTAAEAQSAGAGAIVVSVTGTADTTNPPPLVLPTTQDGAFNDTLIDGTFTAAEGTDLGVCDNAVIDLGTVSYTAYQNVAAGTGAIDAGVTGTGACDNTNNVALTLEGGAFARVGVNATAEITVNVVITDASSNVLVDTDVLLTCEVAAVIDGPSDPQADITGGCSGGAGAEA